MAEDLNADIQEMQNTLTQLNKDEATNPKNDAAVTQEANQVQQLLNDLDAIQDGEPDCSTDISNINTQLGIITSNSNMSNPASFTQANLTNMQNAINSINGSLNDIFTKYENSKSPTSEQTIIDMKNFCNQANENMAELQDQFYVINDDYQSMLQVTGETAYYTQQLGNDLTGLQSTYIPKITATVKQYSTPIENDEATDINNAINPLQPQITEAQKSAEDLLDGLPANFSRLPLMEQAVLIANYAISQMNTSLTKRLTSISKENKALSKYNKYLQVCKNGTTLKPSQTYTAPASFLQFINSCIINNVLPQSVINQLPGMPTFDPTTHKIIYVTTYTTKGSGGGGGQWAADQTSIQNLIQDQTTQINEQMDFVQNTMDQQSNAMQMVSTIIQQGSTADTSVTSAIGAV
ncbi:MAG: hypothetical protein HQL01_02595 [Nitrospirae bacterium]|nr:hypothetical protein [Nitrospirota bacterium]